MKRLPFLFTLFVMFLAPAAFADSTKVRCSEGRIRATPATLRPVDDELHSVQLSFFVAKPDRDEGAQLSFQVDSIECFCVEGMRSRGPLCPNPPIGEVDEVFSTDPVTGTEASGVSTEIQLRASNVQGDCLPGGSKKYEVTITCSDDAGTDTVGLSVKEPPVPGCRHHPCGP